MNENQKLLPIGSVVLLKDATKPLMIIGYLPVATDTKEMFDYSGCLYPEGLISSDKILLFNHSDMQKILFSGLKTKEQEDFINTIINPSK